MKTDTLEKKIKLLSNAQKQKLEDIVDILIVEDNSIRVKKDSNPSKEPIDIKPGFGGGRGIFGNMAEDFDEPLEDMQDYM